MCLAIKNAVFTLATITSIIMLGSPAVGLHGVVASFPAPSQGLWHGDRHSPL